MDQQLTALAEPRRRDILRLIRDRERSVSEIAEHFSISRPAISQHLRVLREAGLVVERKDGRHRFYRADRDRFAVVIRELRSFWAERLDTLKLVAEAEQRRRRS